MRTTTVIGHSSLSQGSRSQSLRARERELSPPRLALLAAVLILTAFVVTGCRSSGKPASASFASVMIPSRTVAEIQGTVEAVFQGEGYSASRTPGGAMVFEKEASRRNQIAYGGLVGAHEGERVNERVRAEIVDLGAGSHRLQCKASMVRQAGDSFFEEEVPLSNFRGRPYQKLLDEVARRLK